MSIEQALSHIDGEFNVVKREKLYVVEDHDASQDPYNLQINAEHIAKVEREVRADEWKFRQTSKQQKQEVAADGRLDPVQQFMIEAGRHRLLTPKEEIELAKRFEKGDLVAKDRMINSNLRLVVANARRYQGQGLELADLIQEGSLGLIRSVEKFDWRKGFRFSTYSTLWIRQAIQRGLENTSRTIRMPVHIAQRARKVGRVERELTARLGHEPTDEEIAAEADMTLKDLREVRDAERKVVSLDKPVGEELDTEYGDLLTLEGPSVSEEVANTLNNQILAEAIADLPYQERIVMESRFGISGDEPVTLKAAGKKLGVTTERARQIEGRALKRLAELPKVAAIKEAETWERPGDEF